MGGVDYMLNASLSVNADLKFLSFEADVDVDGSKVDELEVDAWILGLGIGYHF